MAGPWLSLEILWRKGQVGVSVSGKSPSFFKFWEHDFAAQDAKVKPCTPAWKKTSDIHTMILSHEPHDFKQLEFPTAGQKVP